MTYILVGWLIGAAVMLSLLVRRGDDNDNDNDSALFWAIFWPIAVAWSTLSRMTQ